MARLTFSGSQTIAEYLRARGLSGCSNVRLSLLSGGQSNPTYIVDDGARRCVLRKKPAGQLIASAHAIDREYRVMQALQGSAVPVPRMLGYCDDASLLGTPFYAMEFLEGRVLLDQSIWFGVLAPQGTDASVVRQFAAAIDKALDDAGAHAQLATQSMKVIKAGPAEFGAFISGEIARWGVLIKANHIVINCAARRGGVKSGCRQRSAQKGLSR